MRHQLAIRTRFALITAALAFSVLLAGMLTIYLIERREVAQTLQSQARRAAADLAQAQHKDDVGQRRAQQSGGSSPTRPMPGASISTATHRVVGTPRLAEAFGLAIAIRLLAFRSCSPIGADAACTPTSALPSDDFDVREWR